MRSPELSDASARSVLVRNSTFAAGADAAGGAAAGEGAAAEGCGAFGTDSVTSVRAGVLEGSDRGTSANQPRTAVAQTAPSVHFHRGVIRGRNASRRASIQAAQK